MSCHCQLALAWVGGQSITGVWMIEVPAASHQVPSCCLSLHTFPLTRHCLIKFPAASNWVRSILSSAYSKAIGWVCAVPGCSSSSSTRTLKNTSAHRFPLKSQELLDKWLKVIPRKSFQPSFNSRVCSIHFCPQDSVQGSRNKRKRTEDIIKQRLTSQAVLSLFPNLPKYLNVATRY